MTCIYLNVTKDFGYKNLTYTKIKVGFANIILLSTIYSTVFIINKFLKHYVWHLNILTELLYFMNDAKRIF